MSTFEQILNQAKAARRNEYDVAAMFMLVQINGLPRGEDTIAFVQEQSKKLEEISDKSSDSAGLLRMLDQVKIRHGLPTKNPIKIHSFQEWLGHFENRCADFSPLILMEDRPGEQFLDKIDLEPLLTAFKDGVSPWAYAESFMKNFDGKAN